MHIDELLQGSGEKFRQLIQNSFDMIVLLDSNGIQRFVSESCENILGYKPEELINIPVIDVMIHPDDREKTLKGLQDILENKAFGGTQYRHRHKNGGWVYLEAFGTNQINNPAINYVILNVRDITDRKNVEVALKASELRLSELNATKDRFFSIIGHDLKSPFNSIMGFSDIIREQVKRKDYEGLEKYVDIIYKSSQHAMDLLTNLLEWSRAQTGRIEFNPEYIELTTIINEVVEFFNNSAQQKSIILIKKLPHNQPVFADKYMIYAVLRNLISNGIKFTPRGGEISISIEQHEEAVKVSVIDNGVGIKMENINKLFSIDQGFSTLGTNRETGTGLGLLLCKEFIGMHGGKIWVESKEGKGSVFNFTIPQS